MTQLFETLSRRIRSLEMVEVRVVPETKGGDWDEWPEDLRVRELPEDQCQTK
jgi:hypothetical protein